MLERGIDIHAHILPETDDGAKDWEEAAAMLRAASEEGFKRVIATPHFSFSQNPELLRRKAEQLNEEAYCRSLDIRISLGQEILYFEDIVSFLSEEKTLTLAGSHYVLVEFLPEETFSRIERGVRELVQNGYFPILAHAERYYCLYGKGKLEDIIRSGAYIQMNYRCLEGGLFDRRTSWCRKQVLEGRVHFLGTDMHNMRSRPPKTERAAAWIEKHGGRELLEQLTRENPSYILEDKIIS